MCGLGPGLQGYLAHKKSRMPPTAHRRRARLKLRSGEGGPAPPTLHRCRGADPHHLRESTWMCGVEGYLAHKKRITHATYSTPPAGQAQATIWGRRRSASYPRARQGCRSAPFEGCRYALPEQKYRGAKSTGDLPGVQITQLEAQGPSRTCNESSARRRRSASYLRFRLPTRLLPSIDAFTGVQIRTL